MAKIESEITYKIELTQEEFELVLESLDYLDTERTRKLFSDLVLANRD